MLLGIGLMVWLAIYGIAKGAHALGILITEVVAGVALVGALIFVHRFERMVQQMVQQAAQGLALMCKGTSKQFGAASGRRARTKLTWGCTPRRLSADLVQIDPVHVRYSGYEELLAEHPSGGKCRPGS